jgi:hypothetical protein
LDRRGGPVHYVKSNEDDIIVGNFISTHRWIHEQSLRLLEMANILEACSEISDEVKIKATNDAKDAVTVFDNLSFQCAFFKHMSTEETNDFKYLEEHEWRIVHGDGIEKAGLIINTTKDLPKYRIPLQPSDFQMLIIPDIIMRNQIVQAKQCQEIRDWFEGNLPTMITVEQLQHL